VVSQVLPLLKLLLPLTRKRKKKPKRRLRKKQLRRKRPRNSLYQALAARYSPRKRRLSNSARRKKLSA
jgi:hypothetical protein